MFIEDYLHFLVSKNLTQSGDSVILTSISKQVIKNVALTDRQYALVKERLLKYREVFEQNNFAFNEDDLDNLKLSLRQIDRTKEIKIVEENNARWIEIRFPFNKKEIVKVETLITPSRKNYKHLSGTNTHYIKFSANACVNVVLLFGQSNFLIEQAILDTAKEAMYILENRHLFTPCVVDKKILNVNENLQNKISEEIDLDNPLLLKDRSFRYGIDYFDYQHDETLASTIACRKEKIVYVDPASHSFEEAVKAIAQLKRFPVLVLIDSDSSYEQLKQSFNTFIEYVPAEKQSVLFREETENNKNRYVNDFVKNHNLNNWIDNTTQVVYIKKDKLPKLLVKDQIKPTCILGITSRRSNHYLEAYITHVSDLIIFYDAMKANLYHGKLIG